jgi:uncharacterized protein YegL
MSTFDIRKEDLLNNPTPRVPVCLCLDVSPSMSGRVEWGAHPNTKGIPINELNGGVRDFYRTVKEDARSKYAAEIAVVAFSGKQEVIREFESVERAEPPHLELEVETGGTHIGEAVDVGLKKVQERKDEYRKAGVEAYQPWLVIMTDGHPTDASHLTVAPKIAELVNRKKLIVIAVGIGEGADMDTLAMFSPAYPPLKIKEAKFGEFFRLVSDSINEVSRSQPDESFEFNPKNVKGWEELLR